MLHWNGICYYPSLSNLKHSDLTVTVIVACLLWVWMYNNSPQRLHSDFYMLLDYIMVLCSQSSECYKLSHSQCLCLWDDQENE